MTIVELKPQPTTAEAWCARLRADDVTDAERAAFTQWLNASAENRAEYELAALTVCISRGMKRRSEAGHRPSAMLNIRKLVLAAGVAFLLVGAGWVTWLALVPGYSTSLGEQKTFALEDGSTVELNTLSAMSVGLEPTERHVTLRQGEAFFSVAPDPNRPFIVRAANSEIRVVGTKFNVRVIGDTARVTVVEGHVKVTTLDPPHRAEVMPVIDLLPGQAASVAPDAAPVRIEAVNPAKLTAWREGKLYFDNDSLSSVLQEVNRYTSTPFILADPARANLKLSGVFRIGDIESVAFALRVAYSLHTEQHDDKILIR